MALPPLIWETTDMAVFATTTVESSSGMVVAQSRRAAAAGADVLRSGGNAVDAAVATSLALGAAEPWMSGLGGGCAALIRPPEADVVALDAGMRAPLGLDPRAFELRGDVNDDIFGWPAVVDDRNILGPTSVAVPGLVAGLGLAHGRYGRLPWADVVAPAIALADAGLPVDWYTTLIVATEAHELRRQPAAAAHWLPGGLPPVTENPGSDVRLATPALAASYRRLAEAGPADFYRGDLAATWLADAAAAGTWLDASDLESYAAVFAPPVSFGYRDARIAAMDGLFAGRSLRDTLGHIGASAAPPTLATVAEALRDAYRRRLREQGHAAEVGNTSHFCVVDRDGMLVAWTQTLLSLFGSKVSLPNAGFLLNNGMMWFDPRPGGPNAVAAGAKPLSNMCPTLVERGDGQRFALGACGGRRILPAVAQLICALVDGGDDPKTALDRPRLDVSGGDEALLDDRLGPDVLA
ncbi:MAG: gamma-glutamyltransferase, partial [Pseudomonadota bacterium]